MLNQVAVTLGTSSQNAGLTFQNWDVTEFNVGITAAFTIAGELQVQANALTATYSAADQDFTLSGGVSVGVVKGWTASLTLGHNGEPGLVIGSDGTVGLNDITLALSNLNLGAFSVNSASITFSESTQNGETVLGLAGQGSVSLPGGWTVGGNFAFLFENGGFDLESLGVSILASNAGAPVGDTDIFINYLSGQLNGLGTQDWSISGSIGVALGEGITVGNQTYRIIQTVGSFTLDRNELVLSGSVAIGGYFKNNDPNELASFADLGDLSGNVTLDWGDGVYTVSVNGSFYDGIFTVQGDFKYFQGNIYFLATAGLHVPNGIPLIGGDLLASASFAIQYQESNHAGFFAGWVHLPIIGNVGIELPFSTSPSFNVDGLEFIGNSAIAGIEAGISQHNQYHTYSHQFTIPAGSDPNQDPGAGAETINLVAQWVVNGGGDYYIEATGPTGFDVTDHHGTLGGEGGGGTLGFQNIGNLVAPPGQAITGLQVNNVPSALPPGTYTLTLYTIDNLDPNTIIWTGLAGYEVPSEGGDLTYSQSGSVLTFTQNLAINSDFVSQSRADLYMGTDNTSFSGVKVATTNQFQPVDPVTGGYNVTFTVDLATLAPAPGTYYFFVVLNDGFDNPNTTSYSPAFTAQPPLTGTLTDIGDARNRPLTGWTVFLDLDGNGQYDPVNDPIDITNANGQYAFYYNFQPGNSYAVGVVLPQTGYQLPANTPPTTTFTYNGGTSLVNLQVLQQATIAGTVWNDLTGNGQFTPGVPGVPNVTVYLDLNNDGQLDPGDPQTSTLSDGTYEFLLSSLPPQTSYTVRYVLPAGYLPSSGPTSWPVNLNSDPYFLYGDNNFALQQEATISGTVTGSPISGGQVGPSGPLSSWTVQLTPTSGGNPVTTTTAVNGNYQFTGVAPGSYTVSEQVQSGWQQVAPFTTSPSLSPNFVSEGPVSAVATADFNIDGNLDYAAFIQGSAQIDYFYGNGNGTFGPVHTYTGGLPSSASDMQTGDFNGDGYTDLLVLGSNGTVVIVSGSANGFTSATSGYTPKSQFPLSSPPGAAETDTVYGVAVGEWDGDNKDDFAVFGQATVFPTRQPFFPSEYFYFVDACSSGNNFQPVPVRPS
jgi:hypothetical protein